MGTARTGIDYDALVKDDRVHGRVYTDPAIFEEEMDKIFSRGWVYVGHAGEIPNPGDFRLRSIGRQSVIMVRADDGQVQLLMNRCMHRANAVCQVERGNAKMQYLFLNGRWIRDRSLGHAMQEGYRGLLMTGRYAVAFLFLEVPPDQRLYAGGSATVRVHGKILRQAFHGATELIQVECANGLLLSVRTASREDWGGDVDLEFSPADAVPVQQSGIQQPEARRSQESA